MAEYTGKGMTLNVATGTTLDGITKVSIKDDSAPSPAQLDTTAATDAAYTSIPDPLGGKGSAKATVTVTMQASTVSYADNKAAKLAANTPGTLVFAAGIVTNDDTYTNTTMELLDRTTTITWDSPVATVELIFGSNANGAWGSVA